MSPTLTGCITVFDAARNLRGDGPVPVVYASSAAVYGLTERVPVTEEDSPQPMTAYGADKLGCELHARIAASIHGVPTVGLALLQCLRTTPRSALALCGGDLDLLRAHHVGQPAEAVYGDGDQVRDFIHVSDVVRLTIKAMTTPMTGGEVFNVCTGKGTTVRELADIIADLCQMSPDLIYRTRSAAGRCAHVGRRFDVRAFRQFGVRPRLPLSEGLKDTLAATRERMTLHRRYA